MRQVTKASIERISDLPMLPDLAAEVMAMVSDPTSSMADIRDLIERDPALTAKLLKVANSALFGMRRQIGTIQLALVVLGMNEVSSIVTSLSVFTAFCDMPDDEFFDRKRFWEHSAGCGGIARILSKRLGLKMEGREFVAGLMHDVGRILIDQYFHGEFVQIAARVQGRDGSMRDAEKEFLGVSHDEMGGWLADRWGLPDALIEAVACHHEPGRAELDRPLTAVVHLADLFCRAKGIGFSGETEGFSIVDDEAWKLLAEDHPNLADMDIERFTFELDEEIEKAMEFIRISTSQPDACGEEMP
ncbi:MAG: HDOD domain-containing protein [Candidatus Latescibacteria bacterium]|nr:HDOD domain-containing protein [Candidatus Latescibacterota bacterium]